jgi:hypothetical protein
LSVQNPEERKELQVDGLKVIIALTPTSAAYFVPTDHIILGGISQGCATSIHALLHGGIRPGGFIGPSSRFRFQEGVEGIAKSCTASGAFLEKPRTLFKPASSDARVADLKEPIGRYRIGVSDAGVSHSRRRRWRCPNPQWREIAYSAFACLSHGKRMKMGVTG